MSDANVAAAPPTTIGQVCLHQKAWVVAKLQFVYWDGEKSVHVDGTGDITLGVTKTVDPGDFGVPPGAQFSVYVFVVWGADRQGHEIFTYERGNSRTATYTLTGTTLDTSLAFNGIS